MKLIFKFILATLLVGALGLGISTDKYHSLAIEGWKLFNDRCNSVNPTLIKVRNTHLALGAAVSGRATPSAEQFSGDLGVLLTSADKYIELERNWLDKQSAFMNRWDFKLLAPDYVKTAGKYQLAMYEAYYKYYKVVSDMNKAGDKAKETGTEFQFEGSPTELMSKFQEERWANQDLYFDAFDKGLEIKDWRKYFAQVPPPDCPEENMNIPEYYSPTPTSIPTTNDSDMEIKS